METPGQILRAEREQRKLSVKDIARRLHLNPDYLTAIEQDDYSRIPAEVFTKSYLRMYAGELGLDGDYIIKLYEKRSDSTAPAEEEQPVLESLLKEKIQSIKINRTTVIATAAVLILVAAFFIFREKDSQETAGNATTEERVTQGPSPGEEAARKLTLEIIAEEITWVWVRPDGGEPREWLLRKGQHVEVTAEKFFRLKVGNAGGTRLVLNGEDLGVAGPRGKVVDITIP
jgi:cytoskeletal protein RodZ